MVKVESGKKVANMDYWNEAANTTERRMRDTH